MIIHGFSHRAVTYGMATAQCIERTVLVTFRKSWVPVRSSQMYQRVSLHLHALTIDVPNIKTVSRNDTAKVNLLLALAEVGPISAASYHTV